MRAGQTPPASPRLFAPARGNLGRFGKGEGSLAGHFVECNHTRPRARTPGTVTPQRPKGKPALFSLVMVECLSSDAHTCSPA